MLLSIPSRPRQRCVKRYRGVATSSEARANHGVMPNLSYCSVAVRSSCRASSRLARHVACEQHPRVIVLGVSQPWQGSHVLVVDHGGLEMAGSVVPPGQRRGQDSQSSRHGASSDFVGVDGVEVRVWNQEVVEHRGGCGDRQRVDGVGHESEREQVFVVALNRREVLCCQIVDLGLCSTRVSAVERGCTRARIETPVASGTLRRRL